jgi:hypothetical protein
MPNNRQTRRFLNSSFADKRFLSILEAAEYINRHRSTLDKWRADKVVLPFYQQDKKIMYAVDDLDAYIDSLRVEPIAYSCPDVAPEGEEAAQACG